MADDLPRAALWYARHGWRVFPCIRRDKRPSVDAWNKVATTDERQVGSWWRARPQSNIGIACGRQSDLYVIDVDVKDGKDGEGSLERLIDQLGSIPPTVVQRTGSGGRQLFFRLPEGRFKNTRDQHAPGIDTRAEGGYVVVPPSVHPDGGVYRWVWGPHQLPPAELPTPWQDRLAFRERRTITAPVYRYQSLGPLADQLVEDRSRAIARAAQGARNDTLYRSAFFLAVKAAGGLIDWSTTREVLFRAALSAGLDQREIGTTLKSAEKGAGLWI